MNIIQHVRNVFLKDADVSTKDQNKKQLSQVFIYARSFNK
jgi:hypothetical protein